MTKSPGSPLHQLYRGIVMLAAAGATPVMVPAATTIVAFGDSTTAPREGVRVYAEVLAQHFAETGHDVVVINAGVPANTTADAAARFERDVLAEAPDIVVLQFGINDAAVDVWKTPPVTTPRVSAEQYVLNLITFIRKLRENGSRVVLMTPNSKRWTAKMKAKYGHPPYDPDSRNGYNIVLINYVEQVRRLARARQIPLVDVYAAFEAWEEQGNGRVDELLLDGIHPNTQGHTMIAGMLIDLIDSDKFRTSAETGR